MRFEGIFSPSITPFTREEEVDSSKLTEYLDFLIKGGIHGLFLLGTNGEGPLLTFEEKKEVIRTAVEHVNGKIPVIAGTGCPSTKETVELSKYAEKVGADAVHVVTPYYYPLTQNGVIKHYRKVAESIELPIIIYYIPERTGVKIDVSTLLKLAGIPNIVGVKDSSKDVIWAYNAITLVKEERSDFVLFGGSDALIFTHLILGADGVVSAVSNVFPEIVVELYHEIKKKNLGRAKELQDKVLKIRQALKKCPYLAGVKAALQLRGLDFGEVRSPLEFPDKEKMHELERALRKVGVL
ncbi:dihydrodipicolinate synthase [Thermococcus litoralis DSM 5473]|uniref:4-hydroxy-tetrahydrodipicolinate synthase n=1 Tax=Thermococcus litoralis (strain ATCC 51850 / DSM 5473 / JCM 8560 / NS-C) TaxID=523849 RepID=H3ZQB9_THELN|nr:4-hydroxy-tetrahydrodipicolinate synthase [Thermococcus litoralis]EHR77840.1 dihydrodipicolinate synthase [Thermococcus litoralis DSM 5473]